MLDFLQDFMFVLFFIMGIASSATATFVYHRKHRAPKEAIVFTTNPRKRELAPAKPQMPKLERAAFDAGRSDVRAGWIKWAKYPTRSERDKKIAEEAELTKTEEGMARLEVARIMNRSQSHWGQRYRSGRYQSVSPMYDREAAVDKMMAQVPTAEWSMEDLQEHLSDVGIYGAGSDTTVRGLADRVMLTAALITDRRDESYDPATADISPKFVYHEDHKVQARYIEGRGKGTEDIMDAITAARTRVRDISSAGNALAAANARHAAALAALRETNQPTATRDAHKDYDEQVRAIENSTGE